MTDETIKQLAQKAATESVYQISQDEGDIEPTAEIIAAVFTPAIRDDIAAQVAAALRLVIEWANEHNVGSGAVAVFAESLIPYPSAHQHTDSCYSPVPETEGRGRYLNCGLTAGALDRRKL